MAVSSTSSEPTRVFVIDDSLVVRQAFRSLLSEIPSVRFIGDAPNPIDAVEVFHDTGLPDLFILDIEMPKMNGLDFLKELNRQRPVPVIICSSFVSEHSENLVDALRLGAIEVIEKPKSKVSDFFLEYRQELIAKIETAAHARIKAPRVVMTENTKMPKRLASQLPSAQIIAIGSSTGGVQALEEIFTNLDAGHCGIVVVQHMPKSFTASLAKRMDNLCRHSVVSEALHGDVVEDGRILIAPGDQHMEVLRHGGRFVVALRSGAKVSGHRPSVDVLFDSVARIAGSDAKGFLLTGMGSDGARGLKRMREAGAATFAQNQESSVVFGMPRVALEIGATDNAFSLYQVVREISRSGQKGKESDHR